jgi:glycosyltransferase involved in cell wall biosynthesis
VFRFDPARPAGTHRFDGVDCETGGLQQFRSALARITPDVVAVHGLSEALWPACALVDPATPVCAWLHGSEIPGFFREKVAQLAGPALRAEQEQVLAGRIAFWREVMARWPDNLRLAFVSAASRELMRDDLGPLLQDARTTVLHNPIDTNLFDYRPKQVADRLAVLSIRPYDSRTYGNDLAVCAILALREKPWFGQMRFTLIGDGPLFEATLAPLAGMGEVTIHRGFLTQQEIAQQHKVHGQFLVPTRLDTQGVSRDEAMASGLVPVTNAVHAVPEFVNGICAGLAPANDAKALAQVMAEMVENPALYLARSAAAAARVRAQSGHDLIIPRELAWMKLQGV